jgi:hypothetical protein
MHNATRERLLAIIWDCDERRDAALSAYLVALIQRYLNGLDVTPGTLAYPVGAHPRFSIY